MFAGLTAHWPQVSSSSKNASGKLKRFIIILFAYRNFQVQQRLTNAISHSLKSKEVSNNNIERQEVQYLHHIQNFSLLDDVKNSRELFFLICWCCWAYSSAHSTGYKFTGLFFSLSYSLRPVKLCIKINALRRIWLHIPMWFFRGTTLALWYRGRIRSWKFAGYSLAFLFRLWKGRVKPSLANWRAH